MSLPIGSPANLGNDVNDKTNKPTSFDISKSVVTGGNELKKISFADKEKERRSRANKRFWDNKKILRNESVAERNKKFTQKLDIVEKAWEKCGDEVFSNFTDEINRILKFDPVDRITGSKFSSRWIRPFEDIDKYILQYIIGEQVFIDLLYISK